MEMEIEQPEALYLAPEIIDTPRSLYRIDGRGVRWYYQPDADQFYPSVTSVIRRTMPTPPGLIQWMVSNGDKADQVRDERAAYGTWLHIQIADLLITGEYDLDMMGESIERAAKAEGFDPRSLSWYDDGRKDILAFAAFADRHSLKPIAVEAVLSSSQGYAGAIDIVCEMSIGSGAGGNFIKRDADTGGRRIRAIIDVKSGRKGFYEEHEIQLAMYRDMWEENYPSLPIDRVFNWSPKDWRSAPSWTLKDQTESPSTAKIPHLIELFRISGGTGPGDHLSVSGKIRRGCDLTQHYRYENLQVKMRAAEAA